MDTVEVLYKEILKNELCIVRSLDVCHDRSELGYETTTLLTFHKFDAMLTIYDILYSLKNAAKKLDTTIESLLDSILGKEGSVSDKVKKLVRHLEDLGLLYEFDWDEVGTLAKDSSYYELNSTDDFLLLKRINLVKAELSKDNYDLLKGLDDLEKKGFKTLHGYVLKLLRHAGPFPHDSRVLEAYMLPFLEEKIPERNVPVKNLIQYLKYYFVSNGVDIQKASKVAEYLARKIEESGFASGLTKYQEEMIKELLNAKGPKIGVISAPTGSGKTIIFFIYTIAKTILNKLKNNEMKTIIVYPRKTLAREQLERLIALVYYINIDIEKELGLSKIRISIYDGDSPKSKKDLIKNKEKYTDFRKVTCPSGKSSEVIKYHVEGNEVKLKCGNEEIDWLSEIKDEYLYSDIIITNHSQLSTNLFLSYKSARASIFDKISLIVLDEAHVYTEKNLGDFLHFLLIQMLIYQVRNKLSGEKVGTSRAESFDPTKIEDYVRKVIEENDLDIIFSSATLLSKKIDPNIEFRSFGGLKYDIFEETSDQRPKAIDSFIEFILGKVKNYYKNIIYKPYSKYLGESKETRLIIPVVFFPSPDAAPTTLMLWDATYLLLLSEASFNRLSKVFRKGLAGIMFVDNKEQQTEIASYFISNYILKDRGIDNRLLVSIADPNARGTQILSDLLKLSPEDVFFNYSVIPLFYGSEATKKLIPNWTSYVTLSSFPGFNPVEFATRLRNLAVKASESELKDVYDEKSGTYYFMFHNADIDREERIEKEEALRRGYFRVVLSTSTLELGVDLPNIGFVMQLGLPAQEESLIQRFGRGGRSRDTFRISLGILIARNTGPDIALIDENYAIRKIFFNDKDLTTLQGLREREVVKAFAYLGITNFIHYTVRDKVWEIIQNQNWEDVIRSRANEFLDMFLRLVTDLNGDELERFKREIRDSYMALLTLMGSIQDAIGLAKPDRMNVTLISKGELEKSLENIEGLTSMMSTVQRDETLKELEELLSSLKKGDKFYISNLYSRVPELYHVYFKLRDRLNDLKVKDRGTKGTTAIYNVLIEQLEKLIAAVSPVILPRFGNDTNRKNLFIYLFTYFSKPEMPHYALKQKDASLYDYTFDLDRREYHVKRLGRARSELLYRELPLRRRGR